MGTYRDLTVFRKAFELAMDIFHLSKAFPKEERYSLTDQVRRSSRSVCINISEAYRKRQYPAHFVSKISDADMENAESQTWIEFAVACEYINNEQATRLLNQSAEIGRMLYHIMANPDRYGSHK